MFGFCLFFLGGCLICLVLFGCLMVFVCLFNVASVVFVVYFDLLLLICLVVLGFIVSCLMVCFGF